MLLLLLSCDNKKTEVVAPTVLLSETQMVEVMTDIQIIENAINHRKGKGYRTSNLKTKGFDAIFAHYGITDSVFMENLDYYNENPVMMKRVMDAVNVKFKRIQEELK